MLAALLLGLQAATAAQPPADVSFHATVEVASARVQSRGVNTVSAWADPDGGSATSSSGGRNSRHFELRIDARLAPLLGGLDQLQPQATASGPRR